MSEISELKDIVLSIQDRMISMHDEMCTRFDAVDKRFESVDKRFEEMDKRFEEMDKRFEEKLDKRFDKFSVDISVELRNVYELIGSSHSELSKRIDKLEERVGKVETILSDRWEIPDLKFKVDAIEIEVRKHSDQIARLNNYCFN